MNFDEGKHEYTHNGVVYTSTTQLLKKYGLSADYSGISDAVLQHAASKGKAVHKALEFYVKGDRSGLGLVPEVDLFHDYVTQWQLDLTTAKSEEIYFDDVAHIAGTVDFQYMIDGELIIADFKTTSALHADVVAWQLSIYNYLISKGDMMTYYFNKLKVFHFTAGKLAVKDVYTVDFDQVKALFDANLRGDATFAYVKNTKIVSATQEALIKQILLERGQYQKLVEQLNERLDVVLDVVKTNMEKQKDFSFITPDYKLTYIGTTTRISFDTKKVTEFIKAQGKSVSSFQRETILAPTIKVFEANAKPSNKKGSKHGED